MASHLERRRRKQLSETDRVLVRETCPGLWPHNTPLFHPPFPCLASPGRVWGRGGLPRSCTLHRVVESRVGGEEESSGVASGTGRKECPGEC